MKVQRIGGNHSASPIYAGGHIYFLDETGNTTDAATEFRRIARNAIEERTLASSAAVEGRFYLRTEDRLHCMRKAP